MPIVTNKTELTAAEKRCLSAFSKLSLRHRVPPTGEELAAEMGVSRQTAFYHLGRLERKGLIRRQGRAQRNLELVVPRAARSVHTRSVHTRSVRAPRKRSA
jgi:DNA-binding MarR family transcriptional regulator